jgi:hypothetical protein
LGRRETPNQRRLTIDNYISHMPSQQGLGCGLAKGVREKHNREDCDSGGDETQSAVHNPPKERYFFPVRFVRFHRKYLPGVALPVMGEATFATGKADCLRVENVPSSP